ncbi:Acyltransferase 3 [Metarhizium album ARSEF 1941]|uniref:Acyltransferase 3 n=1 Tax=Metarhizium album (strain ARSEF 1941) TaxID=1081103 RepID=A0A0B2X4Q0_METAS|nr:Acyltransferase 3 [Metarhizium album ARSEF 1941]KHO00246.1 Acyltransferase 3 [Metarhizium album ARSEF 1941]
MADYLLRRLYIGAARARSFLSRPPGRSDQPDELSLSLLSSSDDGELGACQRGRRSCTEITHSLSLSLHRALALVRPSLVAVAPSFISNIYYPSKPRALHKTSFLDGLRGYAAFIVAVFHLAGIQPDNVWVNETWGVNEREGMGSNLLQLPFIRVLFLGVPMVAFFFLISGFVLSYKSLLLIRSGEHERLSESLVSLIFRRGLRLFLPSIAGITFEKVVVPCVYSGPPPVSTMMSDVYAQVSALVFCWRWDKHNADLFTIPIDGHWAVALFMVGLFAAEVEAVIEERRRGQRQENGSRSAARCGPWTSRLQSALWIAVFLVGLYLAGYPMERAEISPGFRWLLSHTPKVYRDGDGFILPAKFWCSVSAVLVCAALFRVPTLQRAFTTPVAQYLGDVSYSVYLVHHGIQITAGADIKSKVHSWFGADDGQWKRAAVLVVDIVLVMGLTVWVADIFWRLVDRPVVRFSRYFDEIVTPKG